MLLFCLKVMTDKTEYSSVWGLHSRDYVTILYSLTSARFKDYAKEDMSVLLSYCNTLLGLSPSSACRDFPPAIVWFSTLNIQQWNQRARLSDLSLVCYRNMINISPGKCFLWIPHDWRQAKVKCFTEKCSALFESETILTSFDENGNANTKMEIHFEDLSSVTGLCGMYQKYLKKKRDFNEQVSQSLQCSHWFAVFLCSVISLVVLGSVFLSICVGVASPDFQRCFSLHTCSSRASSAQPCSYCLPGLIRSPSVLFFFSWFSSAASLHLLHQFSLHFSLCGVISIVCLWSCTEFSE